MSKEKSFITMNFSREEVDCILKAYVKGLEIAKDGNKASNIEVCFKDPDTELYLDNFVTYVELTF